LDAFKDSFRVGNVALQNSGGQRLAHRARNALHLRTGVVAILLHKMEQQNHAKKENKHHSDDRDHRHLFNG